MISSRYAWRIVLATSLLAGAAAGAPVKIQKVDFSKKLKQATRVLKKMGLKPAALISVNYHVLYVGNLEFAKERRRILEATRMNFLSFMRQRLNVKVNPKPGKLLVVILETEKQMGDFYQHTSPDLPPIPTTLIGYYAIDHNWAVFYDQLKGKGMQSVMASFNDMARQIRAIPGGNGALIEVTRPTGKVRMTKGRLIQEMQAKWQDVVGGMLAQNTAVTQHEAAHQLAFNVGIQKRGAAYPFWVSEGLASTFEVPAKSKRSRKMGAGRTNYVRLADYLRIKKADKLVGLRTLVALQQDKRLSLPHVILYAESWAVFSFLFRWHQQELSAYMAHLAERPANPDKPYDELAEFHRFFKKQSLDDLERRLDLYIKNLK